MAQSVRLRLDTALAIYFCDPQSSRQRGANENTNGSLRQYFSKGTGISRCTKREHEAVAGALNCRPRPLEPKKYCPFIVQQRQVSSQTPINLPV